MSTLNYLSQNTNINAPTSKVWDILTNPLYTKVLGNEFDKDAFLLSDWKKGSEVNFVYEPDRVVATGTITELRKEKLIKMEYNFHGFTYTEEIGLDSKEEGTILSIDAGPYGEDFEAQKVVWNNWLLKVKELSENR